MEKLNNHVPTKSQSFIKNTCITASLNLADFQLFELGICKFPLGFAFLLEMKVNYTVFTLP